MVNRLVIQAGRLLGLTTIVALAGCQTAGLSPGTAGHSAGSPGQSAGSVTYHGPGWASYLDTQPGRSCTLSGAISAGLAGTITSRITQTVIARSATATGEVLRYRIKVTSSGTPHLNTSLTVPYEVLNDGSLGVTPDVQSLGGGLIFSFRGMQIYPTISALRSGQSTSSTLTGVLTATTAAARQQLASGLTSGKALEFRIAFKVSPAPVKAVISTPSGVYRNVIGVRTAMTKLTALNATAEVRKAFSGVSGFSKSLGQDELYFARGVGMVESDSGGLIQSLHKCTP